VYSSGDEFGRPVSLQAIPSAGPRSPADADRAESNAESHAGTTYPSRYAATGLAHDSGCAHDAAGDTANAGAAAGRRNANVAGTGAPAALYPGTQPVQSVWHDELSAGWAAGAGSTESQPVNRSLVVSPRPSPLTPYSLLVCQKGVTYLVVMCAIALMGVAMTAVGKQWSVEMKRDREAELAFRGNRIKAALEAYAADYEVMKATRPNRYPVNLQQLTQKPKRYLPRVYKDPITGQDFELIKVGAEIRGVRSRSKGVPLDQVRFKKAATYHDVLFQAMPPSGGQPCGPGAVAINPLNPLAGCVPAAQATPAAGPQSQAGQAAPQAPPQALP